MALPKILDRLFTVLSFEFGGFFFSWYINKNMSGEGMSGNYCY